VLFQKFCPDNTGNFDFTVFDPSDETYFHCGDYQNILKMPVWSRHGVPGLGYSDENWNVDAHHYTGVKVSKIVYRLVLAVVKCDFYKFGQHLDFGKYLFLFGKNLDL